MTGKTAIEWTDTVWNPVTGCTRVSAGCDHCYAFEWHDRIHLQWKRGDRPTAPAQYHVPFSAVQTLPARLLDPIRWERPRKVFVDSMGDLFHKDVPDEYIAQVFAAMALSHRHTFQLLTKRPERMAAWVTEQTASWIAEVAETLPSFKDRRVTIQHFRERGRWPLPNVWLGTSVENQQAAEERIPNLLNTPAAFRFLSCEPLLGEVNLSWATRGIPDPTCHVCAGSGSVPTYDPIRYPGGSACPRCDGERYLWLDWVIVGGESGAHARPMHPQWARSLRDQCVATRVPFFFKQHGEWIPIQPMNGSDQWSDGEMPLNPDGFDCRGYESLIDDGAWLMRRVGKKAAGRVLDGRTWDEHPGGAS